MHVLLAATLLLSQPDPGTASVHGIVLRHDGTAAGGARLDLRCNDWRQTLAAGPDGTFAFIDAPATRCTLVAQSPDDASAGVSLDLPPARQTRLPVVLPAGITTSSTPAPAGLRIDLSWDPAASSHGGLLQRTRVVGFSSWSSALEPATPGARPDQWTVGAAIRRPGPWGTLFTGSVSARRVVGSPTVLSDVTGTPAPNGVQWSTLFDPRRPTMVWDVRVGLEKHWTIGGTDVTVFGDAYRSMQGGRGGDTVLPEATTKGLRTGAAGRLGVKVGF